MRLLFYSIFEIYQIQYSCKEQALFKTTGGNSLVVQWLGLGTFPDVAPGSIPGGGTKITQAPRHGQKETKLG